MLVQGGQLRSCILRLGGVDAFSVGGAVENPHIVLSWYQESCPASEAGSGSVKNGEYARLRKVNRNITMEIHHL